MDGIRNAKLCHFSCVMPSCSVLLFDNNTQLIYLKAMDQSSERMSSDISDDAKHAEVKSPCVEESGNDTCDESGNGSSYMRRKRMRSSFKHHQLKIMKSHFQMNHNPDAKELHEIALKTGLMTRVIQVSVVAVLTSVINLD